MKGNIPNKSQEARVLARLKEANGAWVSKQVFVREMALTQAGRALWNLENDSKWRAQYVGKKIEHSDFTDEYKFKSYRLVPIDPINRIMEKVVNFTAPMFGKYNQAMV